MSELSLAAKAFLVAEDETGQLEGQKADLDRQIAISRSNRDNLKSKLEKVFMDSGDTTITVLADLGTAITLSRRGSYCEMHVSPVDSDAEYVAVAKASFPLPTPTPMGG